MKNINQELKSAYIFLLGQFVSQFGSKLTSYGLILWAYKQSGSVLSTALLSICYLVPEIFLNFIAGSISDRWNKKKIMLVADTVAAIFSTSIIGLLVTGTMRIEYLYVINIILGVTDAFQSPASEVAISLMVEEKHYIKTSGLQSFFGAFMTIFAPVVATAVYAFSGLITIVCIDLSTFVFAFMTLLLFVKIPEVKGKEVEGESVWQKCMSGISFIKRTEGLTELISFMAFVNLIAAIYNTNLAPMVLSRTGNNDVALGIVSSMVGVAGIVGSFLVPKTEKVKKKTLLSIDVMAVSFLVCNGLLGIGRNYYVWMIAVFLGNVLVPILTANVTYIMRTRIPIEMQGRVFSARNTMQYMSIPIGNFLGGILADKVFEPFMQYESSLRNICVRLVGKGTGSGIGLLFIVLSLAGVLGCIYFRTNKKMRKLDEEDTY